MEAYKTMLSLSRDPDEVGNRTRGWDPENRRAGLSRGTRREPSVTREDLLPPAPSPAPAGAPPRAPRQSGPARARVAWGSTGWCGLPQLAFLALIFADKPGRLTFCLGLVLSFQLASGPIGRPFPSYSQAKSIDPIPIMYPALC